MRYLQPIDSSSVRKIFRKSRASHLPRNSARYKLGEHPEVDRNEVENNSILEVYAYIRSKAKDGLSVTNL